MKILPMDAALRWPSLQIRGDFGLMLPINSVVKIKMVLQVRSEDQICVKVTVLQSFAEICDELNDISFGV